VKGNSVARIRTIRPVLSVPHAGMINANSVESESCSVTICSNAVIRMMLGVGVDGWPAVVVVELLVEDTRRVHSQSDNQRANGEVLSHIKDSAVTK